VSIARALADCGVARIQVGSFVHPKRVPNMADTDELFARLGSYGNAIFSALALNMKGVERAIAANVSHLSMSVSASETHSRDNTGKSVAEARANILPMIERAKGSGIAVRAGIQCAFGRDLESDVPPDRVVEIARTYRDAGVGEVNLADTAGVANPKSVGEMVARVHEAVGEDMRLSLHLHDTRGLGLANMVAGWQAGVAIFDAAIGGAGGCPFIPDAAGNIATEDAAYALEQMGVKTGIDWRRLSALAADVEETLRRPLPGRMMHLQRKVA
jgi:hydroxymethylglutaryl-CoA lyase